MMRIKECLNSLPDKVVSGLLAALFLLLLAGIMPATQLWDWDESFYGRTAIEMLRSGNFLVPTFNGEIFPHKTPLIYWLMALSVSVFGETEFAVRFPSAIAVSGSAWLIYKIGKILFSPQTGLWAMAIFASSLLTIVIGSAALLDGVLLFSICLSFWAHARLLARLGSDRASVAVFGLGLMLSVYAKGPVGPVVICLAAIISWYLLPSTQLPPRSKLFALVGVSVAAFFGFLLWLIPVIRQGGDAVISQGVGLHIIGRALVPMEGHGGSGFWGYMATLPFYVPIIVIGCMPWSLLLPVAITDANKTFDRKTKILLLSWGLPIFCVFSLSATKLPHYIFPVFPVVSLVLAAYVAKTIHSSGFSKSALLGVFVFAVFYIAMGFGFLYVFKNQLIAHWSMYLLFFSAFVLLFVGVSLYLYRKNIALMACFFMLSSFFLLYNVFWYVLPNVEKSIKVSKNIGAEISKLVHTDPLLFMAGYTEPSLVFYAHLDTGMPFKNLPASDDDLMTIVALSRNLLFVVTEAELDRLKRALTGRDYEIRKKMDVINTNNDSRVRQVYLIFSKSK